ncbi:hypothetical protein T440DRAFT_223516 [Plenodomus tracheiphilus IPT5]|uniref:Uncharacterized protein n=1 Tax=Plenodomus tracheiphilus IPT5 TaxID=1408161 RepID=A0A6A7AX81_9PLEO|nr:hypothetical protein T440DRAFT_223516 [Plenodomus tracheiphilus IPT5]
MRWRAAGSGGGMGVAHLVLQTLTRSSGRTRCRQGRGREPTRLTGAPALRYCHGFVEGVVLGEIEICPRERSRVYVTDSRAYQVVR